MPGVEVGRSVDSGGRTGSAGRVVKREVTGRENVEVEEEERTSDAAFAWSFRGVARFPRDLGGAPWSSCELQGAMSRRAR
jgi:hypothetical protein